MAASRDLKINITADTSEFERAMNEAAASVARLRGHAPELAVAALFTLRASRRRRYDPRRFIDMWHASACWRFARKASR